MTFNKKYFLKVWIATLSLFYIGFWNLSLAQTETGFGDMEGKMSKHIFDDLTDSLSSPEILELQDETGMTIWFGRHIFKDVCFYGECKMIRLWLFWDGAGNYLGIQTDDKEPLTKSDHELFEASDYDKLNSILRDTASILKGLLQEELIIVPDSINPYEVDGYSGATQPVLADVIVKDAVYTCHTLWHTVYGPSQKFIREILFQRLNEEFLSKMFATQKPENVFWAIQAIQEFPIYHEAFYSRIMDYIKSDNSNLAEQACYYFRPELLLDTSVQYQLVNVLAEANMDMKYEILWKFIEFGKADEFVVLKILKMFSEQDLGIGEYNLILRLVTLEHLKENEEIGQTILHLSEHENDYVRNLTRKMLEKKGLTNADLSKLMMF